VQRPKASPVVRGICLHCVINRHSMSSTPTNRNKQCSTKLSEFVLTWQRS